MSEGRKPIPWSRRRKQLAGLLILCLALALSGCETFRFYRQAIGGEYQILAHRQPIQKLLAQAQTAPDLRDKLQLVLRLRDFAPKDLVVSVRRQSKISRLFFRARGPALRRQTGETRRGGLR